MSQISGVMICLAYLLGLLATGIPGKIGGLSIGSVMLLLIGVSVGLIGRRHWRFLPKLPVGIMAGLVAFAAGLYFDWKMPEAAATDISRYATSDSPVIVTGKIISTPRLTRSEMVQFELEATALQPVPQQQSIGQEVSKGSLRTAPAASPITSPITSPIARDRSPQPVTGKLYVTVANDRSHPFYPHRIYPGQKVSVKGELYLPRPAGNPGGFDFSKYLRRSGIFTGMLGETVQISEKNSPPLLWTIRQRIVAAQTAGAGDRTGTLLSAIVIGRRGVDVPYDLQDAFARVGLAHVLAASGFQVTLLVSVVLSLTRRLSPPARFAIGMAALIFYVGLTGAEAPALRAGIMGSVVLLATTIERKVKILPVLLFAATAMLLFDPLSIWDLGFQMSFLATLGLVVTVPTLNKWLDWLPPRLTEMISVPTAAYLWLLPIQLGAFGVVSPYSIPINVMTSPIVYLVSIGGMVSAVAGLVMPALGSAIAWLLAFPTNGLIWLAETGTQLPGSGFAAGAIQPLQILMLYGLFLLVWQSPAWRQNWWIASILGFLLVAIPLGYASTQLRLTVLQANAPILLVQDRGQIGLLNMGRQKDAQFTVLPLLQRQGINHLDWAIDLNLNQDSIAAWNYLLQQMPVPLFFSRTASAESIAAYQDLNRTIRSQQGQTITLAPGQPIDLGAIQLKPLSFRPIALQLTVPGKTWLLLQNLSPRSETLSALIPALPRADVLWWSGAWRDDRFAQPSQTDRLLQQVQPQTAIVSGDPPRQQNKLDAQQITTYVTNQDGAVQWMGGDRRFLGWQKEGFRRFAGDAVQ